MIKIILIIIAICVIISIVQKVIEIAQNVILVIGKILKVLFKVLCIGFAIKFYKITFLIISLYLISKVISKVMYKKRLENWINEKSPALSSYKVDDIMKSITCNLKENDSNKDDYKFDVYNIPYGRAQAFLNYFNKTIDTEEVYYYSPICSSNNDEIREYGLAITQTGIYISKEPYVSGSNSKEIIIPFEGLYNVEVKDNELKVQNIDINNKTLKETVVSSCKLTISLNKLKEICNTISDKKLNHSLSKNTIYVEDIYKESIDNAEEKFNSLQNVDSIKKSVEVGGLIEANKNFNTEFSDLKNYMNGSRGNGYGAEYANNTLDKLQGKCVINEAQNLENGKQVKHGADRVVNDVNIQTKYYRTASDTINSAFENKQAIYLNKDGTMMQIEVPRDQYAQAVEIMQSKIDSGQVPNVKPGEDARNYVRKGYFTYAQSFNVCKSGTIESLSIDFIDGAICSSVAGGISATIVFAMSIWNGKDLKDAAKDGLNVGLNILGRGAVIYTLTMQLSRNEFANPLIKQYTKDGIYQGLSGIQNPVFTASEKLALNISTSKLASTTLGNNLGLAQITGKQLISSGITGVVIFGPDICKSLTGKISTKQLFKNSAVSASGIGGGLLGQALIPIPIAGAVVGGMVSSFVAKKLLDSFIEDDAKEMFQILKEEFLDVVMLSNLTEDEFNKVVIMTLCNEKLPKLLQEMYASQDCRNFARDAIVSTAVINVLSNRNIVEEGIFDDGYALILQEA